MSKMNTEKKLVRPKLVLNREMLRTLSAQTLEEVAGGWNPWSLGCVPYSLDCPLPHPPWW
jgi:hypothetical protein